MQRINAWHNCLFLSTPSGWRATVLICVGCPETLDFYPRPPGGGRHSILITTPRWKRNFYPRPPGGGRLSTSTPIWRSLYFYPRPPGGGRPFYLADQKYQSAISIHALRVEGDNWKICSSVCGNINFYPRPPGGGRHFAYCRQWHVTWYFYPRPPGGGRLSLYRYHQKFLKISIHALRVEGDLLDI